MALPFTRTKQVGFTLSELLIALGILGIIAVFTIPKIIASNTDAQKKAIFREVYGALSSIYDTGYKTGQLTHANALTYVASQMNAIKLCPTNASTEGCISSTKVSVATNVPGFTLANGAQVWMYTGSAEDFIIDWNGDAGSNTIGDDIIHFYGVSTNGVWCQIRPGLVSVPDPSICINSTAFYSLYQWIFSP